MPRFLTENATAVQLAISRKQAKQGSITINLRVMTRDCQAGLYRRLALVHSPFPLRWSEVKYLDFKQALIKLFAHSVTVHRKRIAF